MKKEEKQTEKQTPEQGTQALACPPEKKPRTPGLKLFDVLLYPLLTNFGVFGISVAATYLTNKGGMKDANGKLVYGKIGEWFHRRGDGVVNTFKGIGMSHDQADMAKMVFFSFADGTAVAPLVKLVEDKREQIAYRLDKCMGTVPDDLSVYDAEPEQSWFSVIAGRLATASIVVPTAVALDKTGLNTVLFKEPGLKLGQYIAGKPNLAKHFGNLDIADLGKVGVFEAFYTSVCTAGLYFSSRALAALSPRRNKLHVHDTQEPHAVTPALPAPLAETTPPPAQDTPEPLVSQASAESSRHKAHKAHTKPHLVGKKHFTDYAVKSPETDISPAL